MGLILVCRATWCSVADLLDDQCVDGLQKDIQNANLAGVMPLNFVQIAQSCMWDDPSKHT